MSTLNKSIIIAIIIIIKTTTIIIIMIIIMIIIIIIMIIIIIPSWPQNTRLRSGGGHSHVLRADEVLFNLGW